MSDSAHASDAMFGSTKPDPKTQALMDRLNATVMTLGMAVTAHFPPRARMYEVLCHLLANNQLPKQYEAMLSNIAVMIALQLQITESIRKAAETPGDVPAQHAHAEAHDERGEELGDYFPASEYSAGWVVDNDTGERTMALVQNAVVNGTPIRVLSPLPADQAAMLADALRANLAELEAEARASGRVN